MRKVIAAINMTLDGFCDHTAGIPDEEMHHHYAALLENSGVVLYGRITYSLMEFWRTLVANPSGEKAMDDFAKSIDQIPKIIFSRTLKEVDWESASLANQTLEEEVESLKRLQGEDILVGSRSLIIQLMKLHLIDEFQLCVHPVVAGEGHLPLFEHLKDRTILTLEKTKTFPGGAIILYYHPSRTNTYQ